MELNRDELILIKYVLKKNIKSDELFLNDTTNTPTAIEIIKLDMANLTNLLNRVQEELKK